MGFLNELTRAFVNGVREGVEENRQEVTMTSAQEESRKIVNKYKAYCFSYVDSSQAGDPQASLLLGLFLFHLIRSEQAEALTPEQESYAILLFAAALCLLADFQGGDQTRSSEILRLFFEFFQDSEAQHVFMKTVFNDDFRRNMQKQFETGKSYDAIRQVLMMLD